MQLQSSHSISLERPARTAPPRLLSILVPAYQEQSTIGKLLRRVLESDSESLGFAKEVIVCDDGSSDATAEVAQAVARRDRRVHVIRHPENRGKGAAIRSALELASGDYCLVQDADLEFDPEDYALLLERALAGAPAVFGSRFLGAQRPSGMRVPNLVANHALTFLANLLFDAGLTDEATCYKLVRTDVLRSLRLRAQRFELCPELVAKLALAGVSIAEVPISYRARSAAEGKKIRWTDGVEAIWTLLRLRLARGEPCASSAPPAETKVLAR